MSAAEQQACSDAPNSAPENQAGSEKCKRAADAVLRVYDFNIGDALLSIYQFHIQRLDELQQLQPEFFDAKEVGHREVARELMKRATS